MDLTLVFSTIRQGLEHCPIGKWTGNPRMRPSDLNEMMSDIGHLITKAAEQFTDQTCVPLHTDELIAEGWLKIANLNHTGRIAKLPNRLEAFKFIKTAINNHIKGIVQKHRFTQKRTGIKPPAKGTIDFEARSKPVEISLDDPESNYQHPAEPAAEADDAELIQDFSRYLTPMEKLVLDQVRLPNRTSFIMAEQKGRKIVTRIDISDPVNLAYGLGIPLALFLEVQASLRRKHTHYMETRDTAVEIAWNAAVSQLESTFCVEAPASIDHVVIRRMFSMAARHRPDKVVPAVQRNLEIIGARVPKRGQPTDVCFGILYDSLHRVCQACGLNQQCQVESANLELTTLRLHPDILGTGMTRVPAAIEIDPDVVVTPVDRDALAIQPPIVQKAEQLPLAQNPQILRVPEVEPNDRNDTIMRFMVDHFKQIRIDNRTGYCHREGGNLKYTPSFVVENDPTGLCMRFCSPSLELIKKLVKDKRNRSYCLPGDISAKAAIKLIDQHSKERIQDDKNKAELKA